jgi:AraC-like DNA-binding protein
MKYYIRNMVCAGCIMVVKTELENLGIKSHSVELGEIEISDDLPEEQIALFSQAIRGFGFEIMDDKKNYLIEKIKHAIFELVHYTDEEIKVALSDYISYKVNHSYIYLSNLFSEVTGTTIEQYIITKKIDRVKELLICEEFSLSEIAFRMHYSSVAHLSAQFKKVTGLTPSVFKKLKLKRLPAC